MLKTLSVAVCILMISASASMAQRTVSVPSQGNSVAVLHYDQQQEMTPVAEDRSNRTFITDEYGNLYDGRGQLITPRRVKLKR